MFERVIARHAILGDNLTLFGYDLVFRLPCDSRAPDRSSISPLPFPAPPT